MSGAAAGSGRRGPMSGGGLAQTPSSSQRPAPAPRGGEQTVAIEGFGWAGLGAAERIGVDAVLRPRDSGDVGLPWQWLTPECRSTFIGGARGEIGGPNEEIVDLAEMRAGRSAPRWSSGFMETLSLR